MGLCGRLIRLPSYPIGIESLRPDRELAVLAKTLLEAGHSVEIMDWATVECFEQFFADSKPGIGKLRGSSNRIAHSMGDELASQLDAVHAIDFIVFKVAGAGDLAAVAHCAKRFRRSNPDASLILMAPDAVIQKQKNRSLGRLFEWIHTGPASTSLCRAIGSLHEGEAAPSGYDHEDKILEAKPCYDEQIYPALHHSTKVNVFDIEELSHSQVFSVQFPSNQRRESSLSRVTQEMKYILRTVGCSAFHIRSSQGGISERVSQALRLNGLWTKFSCDAAADAFEADGVAALAAAGCQAVDFSVGTGSQRLLDRGPRPGLTVTHAERILRASRFNGMFTVASFRSPGADDDFHTLAETERLIQRTQPDSVVFGAGDGSRRVSRAQRREHEDFLDGIEREGHVMNFGAPMALMAELAGARGEEQSFLNGIHEQIATGDVIGLATSVERINHGATPVRRREVSDALIPYQNAIGN